MKNPLLPVRSRVLSLLAAGALLMAAPDAGAQPAAETPKIT
jgi:hypothetical protein